VSRSVLVVQLRQEAHGANDVQRRADHRERNVARQVLVLTPESDEFLHVDAQEAARADNVENGARRLAEQRKLFEEVERSSCDKGRTTQGEVEDLHGLANIKMDVI
jgi:hypothetical protein